jgi:DNA-binding response OmpR family regulator
MDGLAVCAALKRRMASRAIPIIVLTARDDVATRRAALNLGVREFVAKPARGQALLASIRTHVEDSRKARPPARRRTGKKRPKAKE